MGPNHAAMAGWIRENDPTRPIHYEGAAMTPRDPAWVGRGEPHVHSRPRAREDGEGPGRHPPIVLCEYAYARGNAIGNLRSTGTSSSRRTG